MIRQTGLSATGTDAEERSMRFVEYALAFVAVLAAGILAFIR
jgi:predicted Rossmann-fold nucleotide-binding protein